MKSVLYLIGGLGLATAFMLARQQKRDAQAAFSQQPVEELAHRLQDAWADHHTVA